ncbi:MAG TPA: hypothetical protein EYP85_15410 [Armatimonadetes bacterium]|nr:hypothetical protein [Armatimonadota bacterium]
MSSIPESLHRYFWDVKAETLDADRYAQFVMERLLEYGDEEALRWLYKRFGRQRIREVVCHSRRLSRRTANFWRLLLDIPREEVTCLSKPLPPQSKTFWRP